MFKPASKTKAKMQSDTPLERAFQLAATGRFASINALKVGLRIEGYEIDQVCGFALYRQLRSIMKEAHDRPH